MTRSPAKWLAVLVARGDMKTRSVLIHEIMLEEQSVCVCARAETHTPLRAIVLMWQGCKTNWASFGGRVMRYQGEENKVLAQQRSRLCPN